MKRVFPKLCLIVLWSATWSVSGCGDDSSPAHDGLPFLLFENGEFEVQAVLTENEGNVTGPLGSGTLSFGFSGDMAGAFSCSGSLESDQTEDEAVGAVLVRFEDDVFGAMNEGFSLLGFKPTGSGKANIFLLGTKLDFPLSEIQPGVHYAIGPFGAFRGLYLVGIDIDVFWTGEVDLKEASEMAFEILSGVVTISSRDGLEMSGGFSGTTDPDQSRFSKSFILR